MKGLLSLIACGIAAVSAAAAPLQMAQERILEDLQLAVAFDVRRSPQQCGSSQPCVEVRITNQGSDSITIRHPAEPERRLAVTAYAADGHLITPQQAAVVIDGEPGRQLIEEQIAPKKTLRWVLALHGAATPSEPYTCYVGFRPAVQAKRAAWSEFRRVEAILRAQNVRLEKQ
jgi:hypothetical protein